jgi:hypothetical protein
MTSSFTFLTTVDAVVLSAPERRVLRRWRTDRDLPRDRLFGYVLRELVARDVLVAVDAAGTPVAVDPRHAVALTRGPAFAASLAGSLEPIRRAHGALELHGAGAARAVDATALHRATGSLLRAGASSLVAQGFAVERRGIVPGRTRALRLTPAGRRLRKDLRRFEREGYRWFGRWMASDPRRAAEWLAAAGAIVLLHDDILEEAGLLPDGRPQPDRGRFRDDLLDAATEQATGAALGGATWAARMVAGGIRMMFDG